MRQIKRVLAFFLVLSVIMTNIPITTTYAEETQISTVNSTKSKDEVNFLVERSAFPNNSNCYWAITEDGCLEITGEGDPGTGDTNHPSVIPWYSDYKEIITSCEIDEKVKPSSMNMWFWGCANLKKAPEIPDSVTSCNYTFAECRSLTGDVIINSNLSDSNIFNMFLNAGSSENQITLVYAGDCTVESVKEIAATGENITVLSYTNIGETNVRWGFSSFTETLYIMGEGDPEINAYSPEIVPWNHIRSSIKTVKIENGVTPVSMGMWFYNCTSLSEAPRIPDSVVDFYHAFYRCYSLTGKIFIKNKPSGEQSYSNMFTNVGGSGKEVILFYTGDCDEESAKAMAATGINIEVTKYYPIGTTDCCWYITNDGTLYIKGDGDPKINGTVASDIPWHNYRSDIKSVIMDNTLTPRNMSYWFTDCANLNGVVRIYYPPFGYTNTFLNAGTSDNKVIVTWMNNNAYFPISSPNVVTTSTYAQIGNSEVFWNITDGILDIVGNGDPAVNATVYTDIPWYDRKEEITKVTMENDIKPASMAFWFYECENLTTAPSIPTSVTNCDNMFFECYSLINAPDLPSSIKSLKNMFTGCSSLTGSVYIYTSATDVHTFDDCGDSDNPPVIYYGENCTKENVINMISDGSVVLGAAPTIPIIEGPVESDTWTNLEAEDFTISIDGSSITDIGISDEYIGYKYSIDNGVTWNEYKDEIMWNKETTGTILSAKSYNTADPELESDVANFIIKYDTTAPEILNVSVNDKKVTINATDNGSGIMYYGLTSTPDDSPELEGKGEELWHVSNIIEPEDYGLWYAWVMDAAGNTQVLPKAINVEKRTGTCSVTMENGVYDEIINDPVITAENHDVKTAILTYVNTDTDEIFDKKPVIPGNYKLIVTIPENECYKEVSAECTFTISKGSFTVKEEDYTGIYDEDEHSAIVECEDVTFVYGFEEGVYDLDEMPTFTDVGNYTIYYKATKEYCNDVTGSVTVVIKNADLIIEESDYTGEYDGEAHDATVECDGAKFVYGLEEGIYTLDTMPEFTNAGDYIVYYKATKKNYNDKTGSVAVTIKKIDGEASVTMENWKYGNEEENPLPVSSTNGTENVTYLYKESGKSDKYYTSVKPSVPGTYTVKAIFAKTNNYNEVSATCEFTINNGEFVVESKGYKGVYNAASYGITVACSGATIKYGIEEGYYDLNNSPVYSNAGEYTVYYEVTREYYDTVTGYETVIITQADGLVELSSGNIALTYPKIDTISVTSNKSNGELSVESSNEEIASADINGTTVTIRSGIKEGTATITVIGEETDNYKETVAECTVNVSNGILTVTAEGYQGTYDGNSHGITVNCNKADIIYSESEEDDDYTTEKPEYVNVGTYTTWYKVSKPGYKPVSGKETVTITKAKGGVKASIDSWNYGEDACEPVIITEIRDVEDAVLTYKDIDTGKALNKKPDIPGNYRLHVYMPGNANYEEADIECDFVISKGNLTIEAENYTGVYDGDYCNATVECDETDVLFGMEEGVYNLTDMPEFKDAGKYTIYYKAELEHYNIITGSVTVTIEKAEGDGNVSISDWTYGEEESEVEIESDDYDIKDAVITYAAAGSDEFTAIKPSVPGEYVVKVSFKENKNYIALNVTDTFTIEGLELIVETEDYEGVYDEEWHSATVECDNAIVTYGLEEDVYNLTIMPEFINAGKYTVYYKAEKEYCNTITGSVTVIIEKAEGDGSISIDNWTYGEEESEVEIESDIYDIETALVTYAKEKSKTFTEIKPSTPGEYVAKIKFPSTDNYQSFEESCNFTIHKGDLTVECEDYDGVYDGNEHCAIVECDGAVISYGLKEGDYNLTTMPSYKDAGDYTIYYKVEKEHYNTVTGSTDVKIEKIDGEIILSQTEGFLMYPQEEIIEIISDLGSNEGGTLSIATSDKSIATAEIEGSNIIIYSGTKEGTAIISLTSSETKNYYEAYADYTVTVENGELDIVSSGYKGIYDGNSHSIKVVCDGATITYSETEDGIYKTKKPSYTEIGAYVIWYKVSKPGYKTAMGTETVVINKNETDELSGFIKIEDWAYDEDEKEPVVKSKIYDTSTAIIVYAEQGSEDFTDEKPSIPGKYTVKAIFPATEIYEGYETSCDFTIHNGTLNVEAESYTGVYDGDYCNATVECNETDVLFGMEEGVYNLTDMPEFKDAGKYTVFYKAELEHYNTVTGSVTVTIEKAEGDGDVSISDWTYGEEESDVEIESDTYDVKNAVVTYAVSGNNEFTAVKPSAPGEYVVKVFFEETKNYTALEITDTFIIEKAEFTVETEDYEGIYDGKSHKAIVECDDAVITYGMSKGVYDLTEMPEFTIAGEYTVYFKATKEHYEDVTGYVTVTITQDEGVGSVVIKDWKYGDIESEPVVISKTYDVDTVLISYAEQGSDVFTDIKPSIPGEYTIKAEFPATENYESYETNYNFTIYNGELFVTAKDYTGIYDGNLHSASVECKDAVITYGIEEDSCILDTIPTFINAGEYTVYYKAELEYYDTVIGSVTVNIEKAEGNGIISVSNILFGDMISPIISSDTNTDYTVYYKRSEESEDDYTTKIPASIGEYNIKVVFEESENYKECVIRDSFSIIKNTLKEMPPSKITVPYTIETIDEISLYGYEGWEWEDDDIKLPVEEEYIATAIYTGENAEAYENVTIKITIIRKACTHPKDDWETYEGKESTCTEEGWQEYVICTECEDYVIEKTPISKKPHEYNWEEVVIIKEATKEEDGIFQYACENCGMEETDTYPYNSLEHVTKITLSQTTAEMEVDDTLQLIATAFPEHVTEAGFIWVSNNEDVANVTEDGLVTAIGEGTAIIKAILIDKKIVSEVCVVTVKDDKIPVTEIKLSQSEAEMIIGESLQLEAELLPEEAIKTEIIWKSNNVAIASVTNDGVVTANEKGIAIIKAAIPDGNVSSECVVIVKEKSNIEPSPEPDPELEQLKVGDIVTSKGLNFKVQTGKNNEFVLNCIGLESAGIKKVTIPEAIMVKNAKLKVMSIADNAFKNNKKLKTVIIGKNVEKIGKNAFAGCKNLKKITIKTSKLTSKTVGKKAFKGIHKKAVVKVPKKNLKTYKKILIKKGLPKTAKIKK